MHTGVNFCHVDVLRWLGRIFRNGQADETDGLIVFGGKKVNMVDCYADLAMLIGMGPDGRD